MNEAIWSLVMAAWFLIGLRCADELRHGFRWSNAIGICLATWQIATVLQRLA